MTGGLLDSAERVISVSGALEGSCGGLAAVGGDTEEWGSREPLEGRGQLRKGAAVTAARPSFSASPVTVTVLRTLPPRI